MVEYTAPPSLVVTSVVWEVTVGFPDARVVVLAPVADSVAALVGVDMAAEVVTRRLVVVSMVGGGSAAGGLMCEKANSPRNTNTMTITALPRIHVPFPAFP